MYELEPHYLGLDHFTFCGHSMKTDKPQDWKCTNSDIWTSWSPIDLSLPDVGWKIHIPATADTITVIKEKISAIAFSESIPFKHIRNDNLVRGLNSSDYGLSQAGKCLTLYPPQDEGINYLVGRLVDLLSNYRLPRVVFDYRVCPDTNVYLRYGAFSSCPIRMPIGEVSQGMRLSSGKVVQDSRTSAAPDFAIRRLESWGVTVSRQNELPLLDDRFLSTDLLHRGPNGSVFLGIDLDHLKKVVLKQSFDGDAIDLNGFDATERQIRQRRALTALSGLGIAPSVIHSGRLGKSSVLVTDYCKGRSISSHVSRGILRCEKPNFNEGITIISKLRAALSKASRAGVYNTDLSPSNIFLLPDGTIQIVDFDRVIFSDEVSKGLIASGTPNFAPPPRKVSSKSALSLFSDASMSAISYYILTSVERPCRKDIRTDRAREIITPRNMHKFVPVISKLNWNDQISRRTHKKDPFQKTNDIGLYSGIAGQLLHDLATASNGRQDSPSHKHILFDIYNNLQPLLNHSGLYVGITGVAYVAFLMALLLDDIELQELAAEFETYAFKHNNTSPDILNGRAGILKYLIWRYNMTSREEYLDRAVSLSDDLLKDFDHTLCGWVIPKNYGSLSGKTLLGYAHGAAGIADALLDVWRISGNSHIPTIVSELDKVYDKLSSIKGGIWRWHRETSDGGGASWCHGSAGIGRFYLNAQNILNDRSVAVTGAIGEYLFRKGRWQNPSYCHGLAGSIDFLLERGRATRSAKSIRQAQRLTQSSALQDTTLIDTEESLFTGLMGTRMIKFKATAVFSFSPIIDVRGHNLSKWKY